MTPSDANPDDIDDKASIVVEIFHTVDVEDHMLVFGDNHHKWAMDFTDFDNLSVASTEGGITITTGVLGGPVRAAVTTQHPTETDNWHEHRSVVVNITEQWRTLTDMGMDMGEPSFDPAAPGAHRVDVFARGRTYIIDDYAEEDISTEHMEHYLLVVRPSNEAPEAAPPSPETPAAALAARPGGEPLQRGYQILKE